MASLSLRGLSKRFASGAYALRELSLDVEDGEFLCLVGPSGCGKSTTLSLVAGLEEPSGGSITLGGREVTGLSPGERDIAMVFQSYALYPHLTVRGNLEFPLRMAKVAKEERAKRVAEAAELLGIGPLLERKPRELSGGQRQRVALGRALVRRPAVFLFDEPLSNLDAALRAQMRGELKRLHQRLRATFVYVTHDQAEAMTLSDRVAVLRDGTLQQLGPPRELYERPANTFVAAFFGSPRINLVPREWVGLTGAGQAGFRPEDAKVSLEPLPAPAFEGVVSLVEPLGAETFVTVDVKGNEVIARAERTLPVTAGARAWVLPSREALHRFDDAGRREERE